MQTVHTQMACAYLDQGDLHFHHGQPAAETTPASEAKGKDEVRMELVTQRTKPSFWNVLVVLANVLWRLAGHRRIQQTQTLH